jgi:hypothetical protein
MIHMAVKTAVKTKAKEETETKEEAKVIVDTRLGKMLKDYTASEKQTQGYWLKIVEYVKENELSRDVLKATLIQFRGVQESTANVEATMIMNATKEEHEDLLEQALAGDISVREFRKGIMKKREGKEEDAEKKLAIRLRQAAKYAIEKDQCDDAKEFGRLARETFTEVMEKYTEVESEASTDGEEEAEEDESGEEEADE